jgi:hypothetical protein
VNPPRRAKTRYPLLLLVGGLLASGTLCARADDEVRSNLQVLQLIAGRLADSVAAAGLSHDSTYVTLTVNPQEVRWFLGVSVEQPFRQRGWMLSGSPLTRFGAEFSFYELKVTYSNPHRSGLFGARLADRHVSVRAHVRLSDLRTGSALVDEEKSLQLEDVVEMSLIESLENPSIPQTHGAFPAEGFFTGWAEPLVLLGAVAVAVYLLFTVRS